MKLKRLLLPLKWMLFVILLVALFFLGANYYIHKTTSDNIYSSIDQLPYNDVALVLGSSYKTKRGFINPYFKNRMDAAIELYRNHKVKHILVSGDNHSKEYDESTDMRDYLIQRGVQEKDITLDFAGFRTLDSVVRCKEIFGVTQVTIISQAFHTPRAVFLAEQNGIQCVAYNATKVNNERKVSLREKFARVKAVLDVFFNKAPRFLGQREPIRL